MGVVVQRYAPAALPPGKIPFTHCAGGCVGPGAGEDGCGIPRPHRDSIPGPSSPRESLYRLRCLSPQEEKEIKAEVSHYL
jgi:hypothetical protein